MKSISILNTKRSLFSVVALALLACSCATTALKNTWKSPDFQGGPVRKIAVLAVDERGLVRTVLEGHTTGRLQDRGQTAFRVHELLSLEDIKADKHRAAERLRAEGADTVLILRLVDSAMLGSGSRGAGGEPAGTRSGLVYSSWFDFYLVAWSNTTTGARPTLKQGLYIQSSLFDLATEKPLWSCLTETTVKETSDKLELLKPLVLTIVEAMAADGMIR